MPAVPTAPTGKKAPTPERGRELTASQRSFNKYHRRVRSQIERYFNPRVPPSCVHVPKKTDINGDPEVSICLYLSVLSGMSNFVMHRMGFPGLG
jgi:hypothetical protein